MGMILTDYGDAAYDHEGYAGRVLADGTVSGTWSAQTDAAATGELAAACSCGWIGADRWRADLPGGVPSDALDDQITTAWQIQHAVPVLVAAAGQARRRLARALRELADQVEDGSPADQVTTALEALRGEAADLPGEAPTDR